MEIITFKLWVNNHPKSGECIVLAVSIKDWIATMRTHGKLGATVKVTDIRTGRRYVLRHSECGLPQCNCALRIAKELPRTTSKRALSRVVRRERLW